MDKEEEEVAGEKISGTKGKRGKSVGSQRWGAECGGMKVKMGWRSGRRGGGGQGRGHDKPLCLSLAAWFKVADKLE